jgi:hypothetical protein
MSGRIAEKRESPKVIAAIKRKSDIEATSPCCSNSKTSVKQSGWGGKRSERAHDPCSMNFVEQIPTSTSLEKCTFCSTDESPNRRKVGGGDNRESDDEKYGRNRYENAGMARTQESISKSAGCD